MHNKTVKFITQLCQATQWRTTQHKQAKYQISPKLDKFQLQCYSKCLKWRPLVSMQQCRRLHHWSTALSTILCCRVLCITIGGSQLLRATFESQIFANNAVHQGVMKTSFSGNLARWSMRLWRVFLTQHQVINCVDVVYPCSSRSSAAASSHCRTGVSKFSQQRI